MTKSEFTVEQNTSVTEAITHLRKILHYARSGLESLAADLINEHCFGSTSSLIRAYNLAEPRSQARKAINDGMSAIHALAGLPGRGKFGPTGIYASLSKPERWQQSIETLQGVIDALEEIRPPEKIAGKGSGALKASDPAAAEYRDGNQWCDAKYAETLGISAKHIDRARKGGLYEVRLTIRHKADSIGKPFVYRRAELKELAEAIPDEFKIGVEALGNPASKSPQKKTHNR